ncbi:uncharacterized protein [Maniola hyperantus]|uniref:uncharacterized protein n=1 Tax=Aphantopus hyperantus TaxID=2795564 RepID=UPI00156A2060|nr:serine/arginine repetitive matrix protein 1-like [Maniola hyperantus]
MSDNPKHQRTKSRARGRTGIPRAVVRRDIIDQTITPFPVVVSSRQPLAVASTSRPTPPPNPQEEEVDEPRHIMSGVAKPTLGHEIAKRARPSTSSSGSSDNQEDKRHIEHGQSIIGGGTPPPPAYTSSPPPTERPPTPIAERTALAEPAAPVAVQCTSPTPPTRVGSQLSTSEVPMQMSHSAQSYGQQESDSWPKNSTSYAGLASPSNAEEDVRMASPQPSTSYAATAASPRRTPPPTATSTAQRHPPPPTAAQDTATDPQQPSPRSAYPPIIVECLPNWTRHFETISRALGHAPNARPLGRGVRFLPRTAEEFRAVQRHLTVAAAQDSAISWHCYSPAAEIPTKVAIRGLPLETPTEEVVAALRALGFPAEAARALPPPRGKHGCTYYVRLAHMTQEELRELYATTELLYMPQLTIEAWRGGSKPPQCHRCQLYAHNSVNCHRPFRCVRCAGPHPVRDCTRSRDDPPICANCGQNHAANDRRCSHYKREARRRGIAVPPPPPRAPVGREPPRRGTAAPPTAAQNTAMAPPPQAQEPPASTAASSAPTAAPTTGATMAQDNTRPTTLTATANRPIERGQPLPRRRKRNRTARPRRAEPAAASTPQPRQMRDATGPAQEPITASRPVPVQAVPGTDSAHRPTQAPPPAPTTQINQGEGQSNPDFLAIVRVVMEALMTGLTTYQQGGIRGHVRELTQLSQSQDVHVILLGETKLADHIELRVPNYFVYRRDEISPRGYAYRGTAALVRRDLVHEELEHAPYTSLRTQGVRVQAGEKELNIYAAYRPPNEPFHGTDVHTLLES